MAFLPCGVRKLSAAPPAPTDLLLDAIARLPRTHVARLGRGLADLNAALGFEKAELLFNPD